MTIPSFELFKKTNTNGIGKKERRFIQKYGDISFEEAYSIFVDEIEPLHARIEKIKNFENFLISKGVEPVYSNISESRYYFYAGIKYRFSNHVYPTGSMTSDGVVDLCSDKHLIDGIKF